MDEWTELRNRYALLDDAGILVLNKPAGISVLGERHGTDLLRLAKDAGEPVKPVHRIDKVTSGVLLLAKNTPVQGGLTRQFAQRSVDKAYLAITRSTGLPELGTIDLPLLTASSGRIRVAAERGTIGEDRAVWTVPPEAVFTHVRSFPSATTFARVWDDGEFSLLAVRPITGRRHQIRVHLAWIGHPIEGDPLFDKGAIARGARTHLHAWRLGFDHGGRRIEVEAEPAGDFWAPLADRDPGELLAAADAALERLRARPVDVDMPDDEATAEM